MKIQGLPTGLKEKYVLWKGLNEGLMESIEREVKKFLNKGMKFSFRDLIAYFRWKDYFEGFRDKPYPISHTYTPYIARDMVEKYPALAKLVELRPTRDEINLN